MARPRNTLELLEARAARGVREDRELVVIPRYLPIQHDELPNEVVQPGAQVVEKLPDPDSPGGIGVAADLGEPSDHPLTFSVGLFRDGVGAAVTVSLDCWLKFFEVLRGPGNLESWADQRRLVRSVRGLVHSWHF
jgi:hypothetical protein